jgi:hypothetical protein
VSRVLSTAAKAALTSENTGEVFIPLLTITHNDLSAPVYIASNNENIVSNGKTFIGVPLMISLPGEEPDQLAVATIEFPNVSGEILNEIRAIADPPFVTIQVVLASSPNTVELQADGLTMRECEWDMNVVRGTLRFESITVEPVSELITPERFPSLF